MGDDTDIPRSGSDGVRSCPATDAGAPIHRPRQNPAYGHQRGTRDHIVFEGLYNSSVGLRIIPKSSAFTMRFRYLLGVGISVAAFEGHR